MNADLAGLASAHGLKRSGNRWSGPCPKCGGGVGSDKFMVDDQGGFHCFGCGWHGDRIKWLREMDGMSCKQAHDHEGVSCSPACPQYGPCRDGKLQRRSPRSVAPPREPEQRAVPAIEERQAGETWRTWAEQLLESGRATLAKMPEQIAWLTGRGVPMEAIDHFGLGWVGHDMRVDRAGLGLSAERNGKNRLWVPAGLAIPVRDRSGAMRQLRIRRTPESRERCLPDLKYLAMEGGGNGPAVFGQLERPRAVVVVEAELDAMAVAWAHRGVVAVGLLSVGNGLPAWLRQLCASAPSILVALDADEPGRRAMARWCATFRQARRWPVPAGKDPGDYVRDHGGDLQAWIEAGLPPAVEVAPKQPDPVVSAIQASAQDGSLCPAGCLGGGLGVEAKHYTLALPGGVEVDVTDSKELWSELAAAGRVVFSEWELKRLADACSGLDAEGRQEAVARVMEAKQVFGAAYVARGEVVA